MQVMSPMGSYSFLGNLDHILPEGSKFLKYPQFKLPVGKGMCNKMLRNTEVKIKEPSLMLSGILSEPT